ncbi:MAG TPA: methionyl-tRNA formyltransferase [Dehalococcoidia bacterium]
MRIVVIGQAAFGEAVFKALLERGETVVGAAAPAGTPDRPDPLRAVAAAHGVPVFETRALKRPDVFQQYAALEPDLNVMAFVTDILPERVLALPRLGTIQYHPSLLPRHRGGSAINWAIIQGETRTGLTIFWPDRGIDTGPILLQKEVEIDPDDTVGSLYFNKLFPRGVEAMLEAVALVKAGTAPRIPQDESQATYEPLCRDEESVIDWSRPAREVYNLIRGCNPQPGATARLDGAPLKIFDCALQPEAADGAAPGTVLAVTDQGVTVALDGGTLLVKRVQPPGSPKVSAADFARAAGLAPGRRLS